VRFFTSAAGTIGEELSESHQIEMQAMPLANHHLSYLNAAAAGSGQPDESTCKTKRNIVAF